MAANKISRLGLGCMGMKRSNEEKSIRTIHAAIDNGITLFNTGNFYNGGESEIVVGNALRNVPRDKYFLSVKFGVLFQPLKNNNSGIYGLDVNPFRIKAQLNYSLHRLGLEYVDLYQPARLDSSIPIEDIMEVLVELKEQGFIRNIGLTEIDAETLRRAHKIHPVHTVELEYSLIEREIEKDLIPTARELGVRILTFGSLGHGLLNDRTLEGKVSGAMPSPMLSSENLPKNLPLVRELKAFADSKGVSLSQLMTAWTAAKLPDASTLIGTASPEHLYDNINALSLELSPKDMDIIEKIASSHEVYGNEMRSLTFKDGNVCFAG